MIIADYSQIAISSIFAFQSDLKKDKVNPEAVNIIRHAVLSGIKYYKRTYHAKYGELVLACDGRNYWRADIFPYYKGDRKKKREKSDLDWPLIFDTISTIRDDLENHFPYKVIHFDHAEADDIIAVLAKWTQTNGAVDYGMFEEKQPVLIVSSDADFKQLHKWDNIKQYSPIQKKWVMCKDPAEYLLEHIAKAGDDGIPNVLSDDDTFMDEDKRQNKMTAPKLARFLRDGRDGCENDYQRRNWDRNNALINLELIPDKIQAQIVEAYINMRPRGDKMSVYSYLVKNRCRLLLDHIEEF